MTERNGQTLVTVSHRGMPKHQGAAIVQVMRWQTGMSEQKEFLLVGRGIGCS
jgi:hypothetical protein